MDSSSVGIRELKMKLSKYLKLVKEGKTLTITEHGKPIGRIIPEGYSIQERLQGLVTTGILLQVGSSLPAIEPVTTSMGPKLVSDLVSEDRDVDYLP